MCGIAGFVDTTRASDASSLADRATAMGSRLTHRGPDDSGVWVDADQGVALAHTRLAILDLSSAGHQPMVSPSGRYVLSYNGELYNFRDLAADLARSGVQFRSKSDTEVLLGGFDVWGLQRTLERSNGMFAFALWDRTELVLTLARDRLGEKPLYYGSCERAFVFASELSSVRSHPEVRDQVDREALASFLRYGYVPAPQSIIKGIVKLAAGHLVTMSPLSGQVAAPIPYWRPWELDSPGQAAISSAEAARELHKHLRKAVRLRLEADVPVGAFLSGGVDSSTVVALAQEASSKPVRTFSVGFEDPTLDEARFASAIAERLGTDHTEIQVTFTEALETAPRLGALFDEPFADPSQIPTVLLAAVTRRHVKVALSGDGGDELFGGYSRYTWERRIWSASHAVPLGARRLTAQALAALPSRAYNLLAFQRGSGEFKPPLAERVLKAAALLTAPDRESLYEQMMSYWQVPPVTDGRKGLNPAFFDRRIRRTSDDPLAQVTRVDLATYLPDDILVKVDRATMAVGLETRVPLLDPEVVAFALSLPSAIKVGAGVTKGPLRQVMHQYLPRDLTDRPKRAFSVPLALWLRGPLRDWAEDLLEPVRMGREGYLDVDTIGQHWQEHLSGRRDWHSRIWTVLMFQAWLRDSRQR